MRPQSRSPNKEQSYRNSLRSSSQFLNLVILRSTLNNNSYADRIKNINESFGMKRYSALSSMRIPVNGNNNNNTSNNVHVNNSGSIVDNSNEHDPRNPKMYNKLKHTLDSLQTKISKAQQILSHTMPSHPRKHSPIRSKHNHNHNISNNKHNVQFDIEITLSDMDEKMTKKNQEYSKLINSCSIINGEEKISEISKNSSIATCKINKSKMDNNFHVKYNRQYYISSLLALSHPTPNPKNTKQDPRIRQHIKLNFEVIKKLHNFQALEYKQLSMYRVTLPPNKSDKKTLLLDIDDTILNCDDERDENVRYDFSLEIDDEDGSQFPAYIKLRPYALTFLKNVAKLYEIVAYTGSIQSYAKKVLQEIDPENEIFAHKLYRNSCFQIFNGVYVKDIRIVNRRPQHIVLVDNSPYSYIYQPENGIPILPYEKGPDEELPKLEKYLLWLARYSDIREVNKNIFQFHRYSEFDTIPEMIRGLYEEQR